MASHTTDSESTSEVKPVEALSRSPGAQTYDDEESTCLTDATDRLSYLGEDGRTAITVGRAPGPTSIGHVRARPDSRSASVMWDCSRLPGDHSKGRVLIVDFQYFEEEGIKATFDETSTLEELKNVYNKRENIQNRVLRFIHVQNSPGATEFLFRKFNIGSETKSAEFARWTRHGSSAEYRAKKARLKGKVWSYGDWGRGIDWTAVGFDYIKAYNAGHQGIVDGMKVMELKGYDADEEPAHSYDVVAQRLTCYVQHARSDLKTAHRTPQEIKSIQDVCLLPLDQLENGNTILVFENSCTGSDEDTLLPARGSAEHTLLTMGNLIPTKVEKRDKVVFAALVDVVEELFSALNQNLDHMINICATHCDILENTIYASPADETLAPELWENRNNWLRIQKLICTYLVLIDELRSCFVNLLVYSECHSDPGISLDFFHEQEEQLKKLASDAKEELIKPTNELNDLLYKTVEISHSGHSLQLGTSMWRLSWITFIFLPLTFLASFFGMNVHTFSPTVNIKWYFVSAVVLMLIVLLLWYSVKHALATQRRPLQQRTTYEDLFRDLAARSPQLWTRAGPRTNVHAVGLVARVKWFLLKRWFDVNKLALKQGRKVSMPSLETDMYSRAKYWCAREWSRGIPLAQQDQLSTTESAHKNADIYLGGKVMID